MVYKHKDVGRLDPEKSVNKPFKNVSCQGRRPTSKKILGRGHIPNFDIV